MRTAVADPVVLVLLLLLGGLGLSLFRRRLGGVLLVAGIAALYLLAIPLVSERLLRMAETPSASPPAAVAPSGATQAPQPSLVPRAIVVLGAGGYERAPEYQGDTVDAVSLERIRYGARLQRQTGLPILVTGAGRATPVAESMRRALVEDFGVPVRWVERDARTTHENAEKSAAMLRAEGIDTIYLVTHAVHMRRSRESFERAGLAVVPAATLFTVTDPASRSVLRELVPRAPTLARSSHALREFVGRLWYRLAYANPGASRFG